MKALIAVTTLVVLVLPNPVAAQSREERFDASVQVVSANSSELDATDVGVGARVAWYPVGLIGVEGEIDFYPSDIPDSVAVSAGRIEGLFGVTVGPRIKGIRPFAKLRPGFLTFQEAPEPFGCIAIFPPPLSCVLAAGRTVFALDLGGGVEIAAGKRAFVRVELGDRMLKYPGPAFDRSFTAHSEGFVSHDFRFAAGAGIKF